MNMMFPFEYRKLGHFTYHVLTHPIEIKSYLMKWIMREWEFDHNQAPEEHWTVEWMDLLPKMEFVLEIINLDTIRPNKDLMSVEEFQTSLKERADEREESILRGISIEPLLIRRTVSPWRHAGDTSLVNRDGFELMDGYTRYTVLKRYEQEEVYAYVGSTGIQSLPTLESQK